ncbi:hypothetical protein KKH13_02165 [Patescibacteria group bacterium]|nr:hypothetical protein [Patescibacteria group bacterium]
MTKSVNVLVNVAGIWHGQNDGDNCADFIGQKVVRLATKFDPKLSGQIFVMKKDQKPFTAFHY